MLFFLLTKYKSLVWGLRQKVLLRRSSRVTLQHRKRCRSITPADADREHREEFVHDLSRSRRRKRRRSSNPLPLCSLQQGCENNNNRPQRKHEIKMSAKGKKTTIKNYFLKSVIQMSSSSFCFFICEESKEWHSLALPTAPEPQTRNRTRVGSCQKTKMKPLEHCCKNTHTHTQK